MKKFKLISSIIVALIVISVITFGVIVAISPEYGITNSITFRPENDINFSVVCEASWALGDTTGGKDPSITISIDKDGNIFPSNVWNAPDINFNKVLPENNVVSMSFAFTNTSEDPNNILAISFYDIESDSKDAQLYSNPRFIAETQIDDGAKELVMGNKTGGADAEFLVGFGETKTINIYYTLERNDESFNCPQNIIINIGLEQTTI